MKFTKKLLSVLAFVGLGVIPFCLGVEQDVSTLVMILGFALLALIAILLWAINRPRTNENKVEYIANNASFILIIVFFSVILRHLHELF